jgi:hypothetical protein
VPEDAVALADELIDRLRSMADPDNVAGMARFGISTTGTLGVSMTPLRAVVGELRPLRRSDP